MSACALEKALIGGGSAGYVLANRLSADPRTRVLLLEAGPPDRNVWIMIAEKAADMILEDAKAKPAALPYTARSSPRKRGSRRDCRAPAGFPLARERAVKQT